MPSRRRSPPGLARAMLPHLTAAEPGAAAFAAYQLSGTATPRSASKFHQGHQQSSHSRHRRPEAISSRFRLFSPCVRLTLRLSSDQTALAITQAHTDGVGYPSYNAVAASALVRLLLRVIQAAFRDVKPFFGERMNRLPLFLYTVLQHCCR